MFLGGEKRRKIEFLVANLFGRGTVRMCLGNVCMQFGAVSGLVCVPEGRFCKAILEKLVRGRIMGDRFRRSERVSGR